MARYVTVAYITPVYATVDLDAEPNADGSYDDSAVRLVQHLDSNSLTDDERQKTLDIAENTVWPAWEGY